MSTLTLAEAPFTRKRVGAHYVWAAELDLALTFAKDYGLELWLTDAPYQVAKLLGPDIRIVIYPHKTRGTSNVSLRVRDENSRNTKRARALMALLDRAAGYNNTFSRHYQMDERSLRQPDRAPIRGWSAEVAAEADAIARAQ